MITRTHNGYHLGDNLVHLHFLRKVALSNPERRFVHAAQWQYLKELRDVISDVPNIRLEEFGYMIPKDSINAWRGDNGCWYNNPDRNDFVKFHLETWFPYLAERMEVANPITNREEMLFDYPAINQKPQGPDGFDLLLINSPPGSGQLSAYNHFALSQMADEIKGSVIATNGFDNPAYYPFTVSQIGALSLRCHTILMVSTGPSWPTFNIWNQESVRNRIILLDSERVWLAPHTMHCKSVAEASEILKEIGLL